jgi:PAS domain S-box-containing protein
VRKEGPGTKEGREVPEGSVLDAVSEMISLHSANFTILRANQAFAKAFGTHSTDLIGKKCCEVFYGPSEPPTFCLHKQAMAT